MSMNPLTGKLLMNGFSAPKMTASTMLRISNAAERVYDQIEKRRRAKRELAGEMPY